MYKRVNNEITHKTGMLLQVQTTGIFPFSVLTVFSLVLGSVLLLVKKKIKKNPAFIHILFPLSANCFESNALD